LHSKKSTRDCRGALRKVVHSSMSDIRLFFDLPEKRLPALMDQDCLEGCFSILDN
jgi:hypothetical protein